MICSSSGAASPFFDQPRGKLGETGANLVAGTQLSAIPGELQHIGSGQDVEPGITARKGIRRNRRGRGGGLGVLGESPAMAAIQYHYLALGAAVLDEVANFLS